jgi:hypothetical protein
MILALKIDITLKKQVTKVSFGNHVPGLPRDICAVDIR